MKRNPGGCFLLSTLFFIMSVSAFEKIHAQEFNIENFTTADGLSHNNIRSIARDSTGYLWLGTWDGLSRFDGYNFRNYFHVPNDSTSLSYFSVRQVVVDRYNNLWILSDQKTLQLYDRANDDFYALYEYAGIKLDNIYCIRIDSSGNLMILNNSNIIIWKKQESEAIILNLTDSDGKSYRTDQAFLTDILFNGNEIWLTGNNGAMMFVKEIGNKYILDRTYLIEDPIRKRIDFDRPVWFKLYISSTGNKWIFSNIGLFKCDEEKGIFCVTKENIPLNEFKGNDVLFWGDFYKGVFVYETRNSLLKHIPDDETGLPSAIFPDTDNSLWFSGISPSGVPKGLSKVVFNSGFFRNYLFTAPDSTQPAIYSLGIDNRNNTWVGIRGYDNIVTVTRDGTQSSTGKLSPDSIDAAGHIRSMNVTENGIWIGYYQKLLRFYSFKEKKFKDFKPGPEACRTILVLDGKVYLATNNVYVFDPSSGELQTVWESNTNLSTYKLYPEDDSIIWCGMAKGTLARVNIKTGKGSLIVIPPGQSNAEDLIFDNNGNIWIALLGDGVCRYNPETKETRYYTTQNGLTNNTTYNLMEDKSGNIWVSTNEGISRVNPLTGQIRRFGPSDGLKIHEFNSGAKYKTEDGNFLFGGMGGFVSFNPDSLTSGSARYHRQKIIFSSFDVSGVGRKLNRNINDADTIILKAGEDNFHITFSSSDFANARNKRYRYMLTGVNENWIETGSSNRNLNYSNIKPGYHILKVGANDINGNWTAERSLIIRIQPYFFQTMVFKTGAPAIILFLIITIIVIYIKQLRLKEKQIQETLRLQALQGQMNPHFIFNSLNSINYFISNNDKLSANRYIADFARLIRSILHNMNHNYIKLEKEIESIEDYLKIEYLRFGDKFNYKIKIDDEILPEELKVSPGLVQPFIENAIWHGVRGLERRKGNIVIRFRQYDWKLSCIIEDDGIGRSRSNELKSKNDTKISRGISIITERLRILSNLHNQQYNLTITDVYNDRTETGTRVVVDLPMERTRTENHRK